MWINLALLPQPSNTQKKTVSPGESSETVHKRTWADPGNTMRCCLKKRRKSCNTKEHKRISRVMGQIRRKATDSTGLEIDTSPDLQQAMSAVIPLHYVIHHLMYAPCESPWSLLWIVLDVSHQHLHPKKAWMKLTHTAPRSIPGPRTGDILLLL